MNIKVSLEVPVVIEEDKCVDCEHRFGCWSSRTREIQAYKFEIEKALNKNDQFRAYFDLSNHCFSYGKLCEEVYKPSYVKIEYQGTTFVEKVEISCHRDVKNLKDVTSLEVSGYIA